MEKINKFLVLGGDRRQIFMAKSLIKNGYNVELYGFDEARAAEEGLNNSQSELADVIQNADAIILPLPVSRDGVTVNTSFPKEIGTLAELSELLERDQVVFAGMMSNAWKSNFFKKGIKVYDYFEREELAVYNAIPTAQGVVKIAIDNLPITLHGSKCAVTGYGRTARILARMLGAMGAQITICVRKVSDVAWAKAEGYSGTLLKDMHKRAGEFDILVNTVPNLVVNESILKKLKKDCLIIEIASAPFGIDFTAAADLGLKVVNPGSLPGKTAPKTAGEIIAESIMNIIKEGSE